MNLSNQCLKPCVLVASTTSCGWVVGLKHILCGKNTYFCLLLNFLPAWFHALLVPSCIGRGSENENPHYSVWLMGWWLFLLFTIPCLWLFQSHFRKKLLYPFHCPCCLLVFFAPFAGVFPIGDSDAGIQGTGLGYNNQDQLQYFSTCHPVNWHGILGFIH